MLINLDSPIVQKIYAIAKSGVIKHKSRLLTTCAVYTAIARKTSLGEQVSQKEIAALCGCNRMTVYRVVRFLTEHGFITEVKGKVIKEKNGFSRTPNRYELVKGESEHFLKEKRESFDTVKELLEAFGEPQRKKGKGSRKFYNCPCCAERKVIYEPKKDMAFCYGCDQRYVPRLAQWFNYHKERKRSFYKKTVNLRNRLVSVTFIQSLV